MTGARNEEGRTNMFHTKAFTTRAQSRANKKEGLVAQIQSHCLPVFVGSNDHFDEQALHGYFTTITASN
jgi:hypothetical protein